MFRDLRVDLPTVVRQVYLLTGYQPGAGDGTEAGADEVAIRVLGAGVRRASTRHGVEAHRVEGLRRHALLARRRLGGGGGRGLRRLHRVNGAAVVLAVLAGSAHPGADYAALRQPLARRHYSLLRASADDAISLGGRDACFLSLSLFYSLRVYTLLAKSMNGSIPSTRTIACLPLARSVPLHVALDGRPPLGARSVQQCSRGQSTRGHEDTAHSRIHRVTPDAGARVPRRRESSKFQARGYNTRTLAKRVRRAPP